MFDHLGSPQRASRPPHVELHKLDHRTSPGLRREMASNRKNTEIVTPSLAVTTPPHERKFGGERARGVWGGVCGGSRARLPARNGTAGSLVSGLIFLDGGKEGRRREIYVMSCHSYNLGHEE